MSGFELAEKLDFQLLSISEEEPLLLVDGVMRDWQALRDAAAASTFTQAPPGGFPGLRSGLPGAYVRGMLGRIDPVVQRIFFAGRAVKLARFDCFFSLVTLAPGELHRLQKLPHVDVATPNRIALLHYLCEPHFGGTAFFRQLATELERVGPDERAAWQEARAQELDDLAPEDGYPGETMRHYKQTSAIAAAPDRLIAYRSHNLHSGVIDQPELLSPDPTKGRLTANFFLDYAVTGSR